MNNLENHKYADLFPAISGNEFEEFKRDIELNGLRESIWLYEGKILDGRNRYRACNETNTEPTFKTYEGNDPLGFVVSLNLTRRHLDTSQRAMVAAKLANLNHGQKKSDTEISVSQPEAAKLLNVSTDSVQFAKKVIEKATPELVQMVERNEVSVSVAATISELEEPEQQEIVAKGEKEILQAAKEIRAKKTEARSQERIEKIIEISKGNIDLSTSRTFPVIYADPPWRYEHCSTDNRQIENHYPTMDLGEICCLPVSDLSTSDSILFMWATSPKLSESLEVIKSWGFEYRTCAVWDKKKIGMGYYFRQQHELLLIATKGSIPVPPPHARPSSVVSIDRSKHSEKPDEFYEIIEAMYPDLPKIELFSRNKREGWEVWGNQS